MDSWRLGKGCLLPTLKSWPCSLPASHFSWLQGLGLLPGAVPLVRLLDDHQLGGWEKHRTN